MIWVDKSWTKGPFVKRSFNMDKEMYFETWVELWFPQMVIFRTS